MKKLITMTVLLSIGTLCILEANENNQKKIDFGQKIFRKKLQKKCGYTAGHWAQQHTKVEWKTIQKKGDFKEELLTMCPRAKEVMKDKWVEPLYLFAKEYAKDTGLRPRC